MGDRFVDVDFNNDINHLRDVDHNDFEYGGDHSEYHFLGVGLDNDIDHDNLHDGDDEDDFNHPQVAGHLLRPVENLLCRKEIHGKRLFVGETMIMIMMTILIMIILTSTSKGAHFRVGSYL